MKSYWTPEDAKLLRKVAKKLKKIAGMKVKDHERAAMITGQTVKLARLTSFVLWRDVDFG